jgi:hypothetical protein
MPEGYPMLVCAIRSSGERQWRIADTLGWPDWRLSKIVRRGKATPEEKAALSDLFGVSQAVLFGVGLPVTLPHRPANAEPAA